MQSLASLAFDRNRRLIQIADIARARALRAWQTMDFAALDQSWATVGPLVTQHVTAAQLEAAKGSDRFTAQVATQTPGFTASRSSIVPEAFAGIDGQGRDVAGTMYGAVTTTKEAIGAGFGRVQAMEAGGTYLAAMLKTVIADISRSADLVSSAGKSYTHYVRVCNGSACSRCAMLVGISSGEDAFLRHVSCQCSAVPTSSEGKTKTGVYSTPQEYFDSLSEAEQDRAFTKDGAEAIRSGADITQVVNARRGAKGIGYSSHGASALDPSVRRTLQKTTIGYRPNGDPVQVYATMEGAYRGGFRKMQNQTSVVRKLAGARYTSTARVRLMPESIMKIAGNDLATRQAFLRDSGYLGYISMEQRAADRILVNRATLKYGNFTLG